MPECTYCHREQWANGFLQPPMCAKHHSAAVVLSLIRSRGVSPNLEHARIVVSRYPKTGLSLDELDELCQPLLVEGA